MMRIVFISYSFEDIATNKTQYWLGRELARRGHLVTFIALSERSRFRIERQECDGMRIMLTPRGITGRLHYDGWGPHDVATRLFQLFREPYDVMVAETGRANVYLPFRAMKGRIPLRVVLWNDRWGDGGLARTTSRFAFQRRLEDKWEKLMILDSDGVIATSKELQALGCKWGMPLSRSCWIALGSDVETIRRLPKKSAREQLGLNDSQPVIGFMGHALGNLPEFFPALRGVIRRYPKTVILCIGVCSDRWKVKSSGMAHHFRFSGYLPPVEAGNWLACADLFLVELISTGIHAVRDYYKTSGKISHYLAAGRPIVAPDFGEAGRLFREEGFGLLTRDDLSDCEDRICELIENTELAEQLGAKARLAAEERFSWPILTDRFENFIQNLASRKITFKSQGKLN